MLKYFFFGCIVKLCCCILDLKVGAKNFLEGWLLFESFVLLLELSQMTPKEVKWLTGGCTFTSVCILRRTVTTHLYDVPLFHYCKSSFSVRAKQLLTGGCSLYSLINITLNKIHLVCVPPSTFWLLLWQLRPLLPLFMSVRVHCLEIWTNLLSKTKCAQMNYVRSLLAYEKDEMPKAFALCSLLDCWTSAGICLCYTPIKKRIGQCCKKCFAIFYLPSERLM